MTKIKSQKPEFKEKAETFLNKPTRSERKAK
jgi:hypothetical protein